MSKLNILLAVIAIAFLSILNLSSQTVSVNGRKLFVDGQRYRINGICYSRGSAGNYAEDIALMQEAHINTIRAYNAITDTAELNAFADAGVKIIMHLDENNFKSYVKEHKDHPAILMWEFGNEFNYHPEWFGDDINNWYRKLEYCATETKKIDPTHPITTAHGEVPTLEVLNACPSVDVWGLNLYRFDNNVPAIKEFTARTNRAMYISEAGGDSYDKKANAVNEVAQAQANSAIMNGIINEFDLCIGVAMFEFCDEWWKAGHPDIQNLGESAPNSSGVPYDGSADEEYWGIVNRYRTKKPAFYKLKDIFSSVSDNHDESTPVTKNTAEPGK